MLIVSTGISCRGESFVTTRKHLRVHAQPGKIKKRAYQMKSLMYEKLLSGLDETQVNHLVDYLVSLK
jgi:hypothetical protein